MSTVEKWLIEELQESGFENVEYQMDDFHAVYYDYDGGELKIILEDDENFGEIHYKNEGSEDWYYLGTTEHVPEDYR